MSRVGRGEPVSEGDAVVEGHGVVDGSIVEVEQAQQLIGAADDQGCGLDDDGSVCVDVGRCVERGVFVLPACRAERTCL